jgi:hypothetical protein
MKVFRIRRMTLLGAGFLLGSRAGRGPWDKAAGAWRQVQEKVGSALRRGGMKQKIEQAKEKLGRSSSGNGFGGQRGDLSTTAGRMTEI